MKKRSFMTLLAVALVIAALAMPALALESTMTYKNDSGTIGSGKAAISWGTTIGASTSQTVAMVSTSRSLTLYARIEAAVIVGTGIGYNIDNDVISGTQAIASVNNIYNGEEGEILSAVATYGAGTNNLGAMAIS